MKIHHLNLATMCPFGGRLINGGDGPVFAAATMVAHALLIETDRDGLVLVDTGIGMEAVRRPKRHLGGAFVAMSRPKLLEEETALRRVEALGLSPKDVRHIVVTHLDPDHAGGLCDFPEATVHVHRAEHAAAMAPKTFNERGRYRKVQLAHDPKWALHAPDGETWQGFASVRAVADDVLLVPVHGHTRGHSAVAVKDGEGWLLHCGDAYFFHGEVEEGGTCPAGLANFQKIMAVDDEARRSNAARLRTLAIENARKPAGAPRVRLFSAHCPVELARFSEGEPAARVA